MQVFKSPVAKLLSILSGGAVFAGASVGNTQTQTTPSIAPLPKPPLAVSFEAPDYQLGSIHGQQGWVVEQGVAEVVEGASHGGKRHLRLAPAEPFSQAKLKLAATVPPSAATFVDCWVRPVAVAADSKGELLDIDGARIAFFRSATDASMGEFFVFDGSPANPLWMPTGATAAIDEKSGLAKEWVRLTVRQDFARQVWDLRVNAKWAGANLSFVESLVSHTENYIIMGEAVESVLLDDLVIDPRNPLGSDRDGDGFTDLEEKELKWNPLFDERDADLEKDGKSILSEYIAGLKAPAEGRTALTFPAAPVASVPSGRFKEKFAVELTGSDQADTAIYYTLDGSDPKSAPGRALRYEKPLEISRTTVVRAVSQNPRGRLSDTATAAYIFPADVAVQQPGDHGVPAQMQDLSFWHGSMNNFTFRAGMRTGVDSVSGDAVEKALAESSVVVLVGDPGAFFDAKSGIYTRSSQPGQAACDMIWIPEEGSSPISGAASVSVSGQSSRFHDVSLKHSLRLRLAKPVTVGQLEFGPGNTAGELAHLLLRHPTHDSFAVSDMWPANRQGAKYLADAWANAWMATQGHDFYARKYVHVFLNGAYWGFYEAMEQHDDTYAARHGHPGEKVSLIEPGAGSNQSVSAILGETTAWVKFRNAVGEAVNKAQAGQIVDWAPLLAQVDTRNLIDYIFWNCWASNVDWPERNWLVQERGGKFGFISWDAEYSLRAGEGPLHNNVVRINAASNGPAYVFFAFAHDSGFRAMVREQLRSATGEGGSLALNTLRAQFDSLVAQVRPLISAEYARWGAGSLPATAWEKNVAYVTEKLLPARTAEISRQFEEWVQRMEVNAGMWQERGAKPSKVVATITARPPAIPKKGDAKFDSDGDGLPDSWETSSGTNPLVRDDQTDADGDGLTNLEEFLLGTSPLQQQDRRDFVRETAGEVSTRMAVRVDRQDLARFDRDTAKLEQALAKAVRGGSKVATDEGEADSK